MSFAPQTTGHRNRFLAGLDRIVATIAEERARRRIFRRTYAELNALTDRELADIGVARGDIGEIADEAAARA